MAEIKGVIINSWLSFLKERGGAASVSDAINQLSDNDRRALSTPILPSSWYPFTTLGALGTLTRSVIRSRDKDLTVQIGRYIAEQACSGVYRSLLGKSPSRQIEKFALVEELLFQGVRKIETEETGNCSCIVRYRYERDVSPPQGTCASISGFLSQLLEMSGASTVLATHTQCVARGKDVCEFTITWR